MSKLTEKVSKVISFPWRKYYGYKGQKADIEREIIKEARQLKNAPSFDIRGNPTIYLKTRQEAEDIRERYRKKYLRK